MHHEIACSNLKSIVIATHRNRGRHYFNCAAQLKVVYLGGIALSYEFIISGRGRGPK